MIKRLNFVTTLPTTFERLIEVASFERSKFLAETFFEFFEDLKERKSVTLIKILNLLI